MLAGIKAHPGYLDLRDSLENKRSPDPLNLTRSARYPILTALSQDLCKPIVFVLPRADLLNIAQDELGFWWPQGNLLTFPEPTPLFYERAAWGSTTRRERLRALADLAGFHLPGREPEKVVPIILTTVRGLMTRTLPRRDFLTNTRTIKTGQVTQPEALIQQWVELGYEPSEVVVESGQFSRRGGILDIWTPAADAPCRLEFFGNEVDTLRKFDPSSQRTIEPLLSLQITPAREVLPGRRSPDAELPPETNEFYLPVIHPIQASLLDYLPPNGLIVFFDCELAKSAAGEIEEQAVHLREESIQEGLLDADFPVPYLSWSEMEENFHHRTCLDLGFSAETEPSPLSQAFSFPPRFAGRLKHLVEHLDEITGQGDRFTVVSRQVARLRELWLDPQKSRISLKAALPRVGSSPAMMENAIIFSRIPRSLDGNDRSPGRRQPKLPQPPRMATPILNPGIGSCTWIMASEGSLALYGVIWRALNASSYAWNLTAGISSLCPSTRPTG
jgi:transcription-repair coupling factor (superfamily II helicase)